MVRPVKSESALPSTLTAYGGSGCVAMAVSSDGITIAASTDDYINIYPVCSIWVPCISLIIPTQICPNNLDLQTEVCGNPECLYRRTYDPYIKPPSKVIRMKLGKRRTMSQGTIQILSFFGDKNEFLVGVGPFLLVIYDLTRMDPNPIITIDMRYFGEDAIAYPFTMQASFTILNIYRNYMYNNSTLSCIDFLFSTRPYVPTYYRVLFSEVDKWWFVDCRYTSGILPRDSLDEDVPYILYNHDGSSAIGSKMHKEAHQNSESCVYSNGYMDTDDLNHNQHARPSTTTTTTTTNENTDVENDDTHTSKPTLIQNLGHEIGDFLYNYPQEPDSGSEAQSIGEDGLSSTMEGVADMDAGTENEETQSEDSDTNMNNSDDLEDSKSNASDQTYRDSNFPYLESGALEVSSNFLFRNSEKSVYYGFSLLERRFICSSDKVKKHAKVIGEGTLTYEQEFIFGTFIPLASVVVLKLTLPNKLCVRRGKIRHCELSETSVEILSDIVISAAGMKAHSFISRSLGRLFTILFNDRFYVLKYTTSSVVSTQLEENLTMATVAEEHLNDEVKHYCVNIASHSNKCYRLRNTYDSEEESVSVQFCHYDPVLKVRYTMGCFDTSNGDGYLAICNNYSSQWTLQIFSLSSQSGVDAIRLVLDASKCNGFMQLCWIPFSNKMFVISKMNGELYQLEPKVTRSWVGLIPNFSSIDKNLEFIEDENIFDLEPTARVDSPNDGGDPDDSGADSDILQAVENDIMTSHRYPFTDLGFSLIGNEWLKPMRKPDISQYDAVHHTHEKELHDLYHQLF
ncbi:conserved hypothetical protein [Theileria orientalis strain Shintoku]|uniref:Uncharacterized protein n=1 Tax=Theileria orientalis strain Shintoku TaxID=869250 RepID=J4DPM2_THEOR|nr:conserved hypothetical protein [Theileria orientalis strain Shintoku]BAM40949.1 conserved hypothetical protein [Theileria orientalis strain Shintoku]|eukprot:XP_009691250.1 conserved hypothetical protein [Theileria orientalis strain Shintoku]